MIDHDQQTGDRDGQLGNGSNAESLTPINVTALASGVAAGDESTFRGLSTGRPPDKGQGQGDRALRPPDVPVYRRYSIVAGGWCDQGVEVVDVEHVARQSR